MSFIFKITTTTSPQTFVIPCGNNGTFNATVDYGDGTGSQTVTAYNDSNLTHSFATAGQYTITIDGTFPSVRFNDNVASREALDEVVDLGDVGWVTFFRGFRECTNLTTFNGGTANTSSVTNMYQVFTGCSSLTTLDLSNFDTSSANNMSYMFRGCSSLTNLDIKHFDISSVTDGTSFLQGANNALTTTAYDELLEAWAAQDVQPNVQWHFGDAQYTVETVADWYRPRGGSSLSIINNKLVSIANSTATFGAAQQIDNLIIGKAYIFKANISKSNPSSIIYSRISTDSSLSSTIFNTSINPVNTIFIATQTTMYIGVVVTNHVANDTVTIDAGITVKEITNYTEANAASEIEYSQENVFGSELVVNGNFATDLSGWNTNNAIWYSGRVYLDAVPTSSAYIVQTITDINKAYLISANLEVVQGIAKIQLGSGDGSAQPYPVGVHKIALTVWGGDLGTDGKVYFARDNSIAQFYVDNVSVKEITNAVEYKNIPQSARELYSLEDDIWVGSNELVVNGDFATDSDWTKDVSWTISGGKANHGVSGGNSFLTATIQPDIVVGKTYNIIYEISNYTGIGTCGVSTGAFNNVTVSSNGSFTFTEVAIGTNFRILGRDTNSFSIDNVSVKEIVEVADFIEPVTQGMTLTEAWTTRGTSYLTLSEATSASVRVDATISNTDDGVLMEAGGSGQGVILYVYSGVLYFQCGKGTAYGTASNRAEVSYTLPTGEFGYIIEWSADTSNAVLYVNGLVVDSQAFSEVLLAGSNVGTLGEVEGLVPVNRGGWTTDGAGVYTNTITKCDIFNNQITSDV